MDKSDITLCGNFKAIGSSHGGFFNVMLEPEHIEVLAKRKTHMEAEAYQYAVKTPLVAAIPHFYGMHSMNGTEYIIMEDLTSGFSSPCMADLKVCIRHFNPNYTQEKVNYLRERDMKSTSGKYGLRLVDVLVKKNQEIVKHYTRQQGKLMKIEEVREAIHDLLPTEQIREVFAAKLQIIIDSLMKLKKENPNYRLFQSSVLVVYDGDAVNEKGEIPEDKMRVKLVDLAYLYQDITKETNENVEDGVLLGCNTLMSFVK